MTEGDVQRTVPENIQEHLEIWVRFNRRWRVIHYVLGITATICAITVASQPSFLKAIPCLLECLAWVSAICVALITFLVPTRRAKGYVAAARVLTDACNRYRLDSTYKMKDLLDALKKGEEYIERGDNI